MSVQPTPRDILLIAADWRSRALTLAELQEAGYDVMAVPGLRYGLKAVLRSQVAPRLVLVDVWKDDFATPDRVEELTRALPEVPVVLLVGVFERADYAHLADRVAALLVRPMRVGDVVEHVRAWISPSEDTELERRREEREGIRK